MKKQHVVLGAGQVGLRLAQKLAMRGEAVRVVRRSPPPSETGGLSWVQADLSVPELAERACVDADVIYDCTNPVSYGSWGETLVPLKKGIWHAATETGALLVVLDNLYMYGSVDGPMTEDTPMNPKSKKGEMRARLAQELSRASTDGSLHVTVGRASDFFGPGAGANSFMGERFAKGVIAGKRSLVLGNPDLPRSYSYVPDVVDGLLTLGDNPSLSEGNVFHLPVAQKDESTRHLVESFAQAAGTSPKLLRIPSWIFRVASWFGTDVGGVHEMLYQWQAPFVVDDSRFRETFSVNATRFEEAVGETLRGAHLKEEPPVLASV